VFEQSIGISIDERVGLLLVAVHEGLIRIFGRADGGLEATGLHLTFADEGFGFLAALCTGEI